MGRPPKTLSPVEQRKIQEILDHLNSDLGVENLSKKAHRLDWLYRDFLPKYIEPRNEEDDPEDGPSHVWGSELPPLFELTGSRGPYKIKKNVVDKYFPIMQEVQNRAIKFLDGYISSSGSPPKHDLKRDYLTYIKGGGKKVSRWVPLSEPYYGDNLEDVWNAFLGEMLDRLSLLERFDELRIKKCARSSCNKFYYQPSKKERRFCTSRCYYANNAAAIRAEDRDADNKKRREDYHRRKKEKRRKNKTKERK